MTMPHDDAAPLSPDLSLPVDSLDPAVWDRILSDALAMPDDDIDASIVPDYDESDEITLDDTDFDSIMFIDADATDDSTDANDQAHDEVTHDDVDDMDNGDDNSDFGQHDLTFDVSHDDTFHDNADGHNSAVTYHNDDNGFDTDDIDIDFDING